MTVKGHMVLNHSAPSVKLKGFIMDMTYVFSVESQLSQTVSIAMTVRTN